MDVRSYAISLVSFFDDDFFVDVSILRKSIRKYQQQGCQKNDYRQANKQLHAKQTRKNMQKTSRNYIVDHN
jgi:hypothetical protein